VGCTVKGIRCRIEGRLPQQGGSEHTVGCRVWGVEGGYHSKEVSNAVSLLRDYVGCRV